MTEVGTGTGKQWVTILRYVLYTLHKDRDRHGKPLLPPAIWGKVIFLHLSVILFTGGVPGPGGSAPGGCLVPGGSAPGGGVETSYWNAFLFSIVPIPFPVPVPIPCSVPEPLGLIHTISSENDIVESDAIISIEPYLCLFNPNERKKRKLYVSVEEAYGLGSSQK